MINTIFGSMEYKIGFVKKDSIYFLGKKYNITIKLKAYYEEDGITNKQIESMKWFADNCDYLDRKIAPLILSVYKNAAERFSPRRILFGREGECALLCDDTENPDDGIAITILPDIKILSQDEYL